MRPATYEAVEAGAIACSCTQPKQGGLASTQGRHGVQLPIVPKVHRAVGRDGRRVVDLIARRDGPLDLNGRVAHFDDAAPHLNAAA